MSRQTMQQNPLGDDRSQSARSFRSNSPLPTFHQREPSILSLLTHNQVNSRLEVRDSQQKQLSIRSVNTTKNTSRISYGPYLQPLTFDHQEIPIGSSDSTKNYETLERILKNQNINLKNQNQLLLKEVHRLKKTNYTYKQEYKRVQIQLEEAKEESAAQKKRADQMKDIIMTRLAQLEGKFNQEDSSHFAIEECQSILEALTFSESQIR